MSKLKKTKFSIGAGLAVGLVTGLLGGGGGMLAVPAIGRMGLSAKEAHATAILVILPISLLSAAVYAAGGYADGYTLLWSGAGIVVGGALGAALLNRLNGVFVRILFAAVMTAVGIRLAFGA